MWPKRKHKLVAAPVSQGLVGFEALLQAAGLDYSVEISDVHNLNGSFSIEKFEEDIFTDQIIWPEVPERDEIIAHGKALGQRCITPEEFLAGIWQTEWILSVPPPPALIENRPVLWTILHEAGYSPSLLWEDDKGSWLAERGQGLGWVVSGSWLNLFGGEASWRRPKRGPESTWIVRGDRIDFYSMAGKSTDTRTSDSRTLTPSMARSTPGTSCAVVGPRTSNFVGFIPRWKEPLEEEAACQGIAQALELGVSWFDIKQALRPIWQNICQEWQIHDLGWVQGQGGTELPSEKFDNVENRRAG